MESTTVTQQHKNTYTDSLQLATQLLESTKSTPLVLPSVPHATMMSYLTSINDLDNISSWSEQEQRTLAINTESAMFLTEHNMLFPINDAPTIDNVIKYGDTELIPRAINIKNTKALKGESAVSKVSSLIGIGEITHIPLLHSGIWVTIKPIKDIDIINLESTIANNQIQLGRSTSTLVFSNYSVVFARILTDFALSHIQSTTLKLEPTDDIRDYIKVQDLYLLINGLLYGMFPNGYELIRTCSNSLILENNKPKCTHQLQARVDFRKLVHTNSSHLTDKHRAHMAIRQPNSVTINDVLEYQNTLPINKPTLVEHTINESLFKLELTTPNLKQYLINGEEWVADVINAVQSLFTSTSSIDEKNRLIDESSRSMILGIYNMYITKIILSTGDEISDRKDINDVINVIGSLDTELLNIVGSIKTYINNNVLSVIGLPDYTCPSCKEEQTAIEKQNNTYTPKDFNAIIPLNVLETFFALSAFRALKIRTREIS